MNETQQAEFWRDGLVRLPAAFDARAAPAMQDAVWTELERVHGIRRAAPASWTCTRPSGLQGIKHLPVFAAIGGVATRAGIDALLGADSWTVPKQWGFLLVSFREHDGPWRAPSSGWHVDGDPTFAPQPLFGVRVYSFLSDVAPRAGATAVALGSHRVIERFVRARSGEHRGETPRDFRRALLRSDVWFRRLTSDQPDAERDAYLAAENAIDGHPVRVVELTGRAGDVVLAHPWLLHARAPHCAPTPRFVRSKDIYRDDLPPGTRVFGKVRGAGAVA